jgi:hypothetical protein
MRVVLPLVKSTDGGGLGSGIRSSMPSGWGFGGPIADGELSPATLAAILRDLSASGAVQIRIRPNPLTADLWTRVSGPMLRVPRYAHVLDLAPGVDALWDGLHKERRRGIRKARRKGVEVELDTTGRLLPVYAELHRLSVDRWAGQQNEPVLLSRWRSRRRSPIASLQAMADHLDGGFRLRIAWHKGRPVAGSVVLMGVNAHYTRGAMDRELAGPLCANDLLEWEAIDEAAGAGCGHFHFGESSPGSGVATFKERFGATGIAYEEVRLERLPLTRLDGWARSAAKRVIGFKDA